MTATVLDLGTCNALLDGGGRCPGRLLVTSESDGFLEAVCDQCGSEAVCPPGARRRAEQADDSERPEPWWSD